MDYLSREKQQPQNISYYLVNISLWYTCRKQTSKAVAFTASIKIFNNTCNWFILILASFIYFRKVWSFEESSWSCSACCFDGFLEGCTSMMLASVLEYNTSCCIFNIRFIKYIVVLQTLLKLWYFFGVYVWYCRWISLYCNGKYILKYIALAEVIFHC